MNDFSVVEHNNKISIVKIPSQDKILILYPLIQHIFYNKYENPFISFTETSDETSLFVDQEFFDSVHNLPNNYSRKDNYRLLQIHENDHGIDHIGIVAKIATTFAKNDISILYVNSYNNNFILLEDKDYKKALSLIAVNNSC